MNNEENSKRWHEIDWKEAYEQVEKLQDCLAQAATQGDRKAIYNIQRTLITSFSARAIATRKVVTNSGGKTAGVDKIILENPAQYYYMITELKNIVNKPKQYKSSPLRRVLIPKPNGEKRPLGIPTIIDRTVQALYHLAVDPVVETNSDPNSFGFRKGRSTHDAIAHFRNYMNKKVSPRWVLEADISKCFDKISHEFLLRHTIICHKEVLKQWLKSGVMEKGKYHNTEEGTPQGGIISPTLCNIALNGLEGDILKDFIKSRKTNNAKIKIIRYADDVVITGKNPEVLEQCKQKMEEFIAERGLKLNQLKTRITEIGYGIDLLGFNMVRKSWRSQFNRKSYQGDVLLTRPSEKGIKKIKDKIKNTFEKAKDMTEIIKTLNPIIRGWTEHKRISWHSARIFQNLNKYIWGRIRARFVRSKTGITSQRENYINIKSKLGWIDKQGRTLTDPAKIITRKYRLKRTDLNPYLIENRWYFDEIKDMKVLGAIKEKLYKKYKHKCAVCNQSLLGPEKVEIHHIKAKKDGGTNTLRNLMPLHRICHIKITHNKNFKTIKEMIK